MLEPIILDNTERLLSASGEKSHLSNVSNLIGGSSQMVCLGRGSKAAYPYSSLANICATSDLPPFASWLSTPNNVLLLGDQTSPFNVMAVDLTTGAMSQDFTSAQFNSITEDASGVIWANGINASYYGLWKRTGAGAWTKLLADTAAGYLQRFPNNTIYYISSAGNWYTLNNGAATVSANPLGYNWHTQVGTGTNDSVCSYPITYSSHYLVGLGKLPASPDYYASAIEQVSARYWPASAAAQTSGTIVAPLGNVNWEMLAEFIRPNTAAVTYITLPDMQNGYYTYAPHQFLRLGDTYMLHAVAVGSYLTTASSLPNIGNRKVVMTILNKTTGVNKYIGSLYLTSSSSIGMSATMSSMTLGCVVGARFSQGVLDLWIAQGTYTTAVATDFYGLFKKSLTLNLDF